ncbi:hypothetical protein ABT144_31240 [Streptomyces sp. NPDC002039]|uniref:hypothetical protein n=1 Tax=Streptomyces sp. NPDC002039 TaxID=3154660 RepID=UPI003322EF54
MLVAVTSAALDAPEHPDPRRRAGEVDGLAWWCARVADITDLTWPGAGAGAGGRGRMPSRTDTGGCRRIPAVDLLDHRIDPRAEPMWQLTLNAALDLWP